MKKGLTEIVFILDRSGSMSGLEADTIGGFNSLIKKQGKEPGEAIVSTVLFDDTCDVIHDRVPMDKVAKLTEDTYFVRGCTALLDAVGGAILAVCPCTKYANRKRQNKENMGKHLVRNGFTSNYTRWVHHGEGHRLREGGGETTLGGF